MPTKKQTVETMPEVELTLKELTILLIKHLGHHEGLYDLAFQLRIGTGAMGTDKDNLLPGAMIGIAGVGLKRVEEAWHEHTRCCEGKPQVESEKEGCKAQSMTSSKCFQVPLPLRRITQLTMAS